MDLALFLGRFHSVVVHLPIGFLILAGLMELLAYLKITEQLDKAVSLSLLVGALSSVLAVILGLLLATSGAYPEESLYWHRFLGIAVGLVSVLAWLAKSKFVPIAPKQYSWILIVLITMVFITGHLGGVITHGSNYLVQYAPEFVQQILSDTKVEPLSNMPLNPDSVVVYEHIIDPIFQSKCISCHNTDDQKGGLALSDPESIDEGGDQGEIVHPDDPFESEIFTRVTLPQTSKKFMPPADNPLTFGEVRLLQWWIAEGASYETRLTESSVPEDVQTILLRDYKYDVKPRSYVEVVSVELLGDDVQAQLEQGGWIARKLSEGNNFIEVEPMGDEVSQEQMDMLVAAKEQITWLKLGGNGVTDQMLTVIAQLPNLTRLQLFKNPITDEGVKNLRDLKHVESLNLYGTEVTDNSIEVFESLPTLKRLYLWQSKVSVEGAEKLRSSRPYIDVDTGYEVVSGS